MKYVSLFREFGVKISASVMPYRISNCYTDSKTSRECIVVNFTDREILVGYRDGRTVRLESRDNDTDKPAAYYNKDKEMPDGILVYETLGFSSENYQRIISAERHRLNNTEETRSIGEWIVTEGVPPKQAKMFLSESTEGPSRSLRMYSQRFYTLEDLKKLPRIFYDRDTDLAFCMDVGLQQRFAHPYSERGSALAIGETLFPDLANEDRVDYFNMAIEYVDNTMRTKGMWLRPFDSSAIFFLKAVRNTSLKDGIRVFMPQQDTPEARSDFHEGPETNVLTLEEFKDRYPYLRLFEKYEDAIHFDDQSELKQCRLRLRRMEQEAVVSDTAHQNQMAKLNAERVNIDDKIRLLEEQARQRVSEYEDNNRRREEAHQAALALAKQESEAKVQQLTEDAERLRRQNEDLHRQKQIHREREFEMERRHAEEKAEYENKNHKRKTFWEWIKSIPSLFANAVSAFLTVSKFAAVLL